MMKKLGYLFIVATLTIIGSCAVSQKIGNNKKPHFYKLAHRGGRGLLPENTIASQKLAVDYGCILEMDLQMSKDRKILLSHDGYIDADFCLTPQGKTMTEKEGHGSVLFEMTYDSIAKYDCGSKPYPTFPKQNHFSVSKPLLSVLIDSVETYAKRKNHVNHYSIEIKSSPGRDGKYYPSLEAYVDSAMAIVLRKGIASRTIMQSFDERALRMIHKKWPDMKICYNIGNGQKDNAEGYVETLGFKPQMVSPSYHLVSEEWVDGFHEMSIAVIPYTVNKLERMKSLKEMGVDGLVSDYPNLFKKLN